MKYINYRYFCMALIAGCILTSCVSETILADKEEITAADGKGLLSVAFSVDKLTRTKADPGNGGDPNSGIDYEDNENTFLHFQEEDRVREIRIILYDAEGKAKYVKDYDISVASQWAKNKHPDYQTKAFEVERQEYQIAVLVNYKNEWKYYTNDRDEESTDIAARTKEVGHEASVLTDTPFDFSVDADNNSYKAKTFLMQTLTGVYDTPPWYIPSAYWKTNAYFFMSNADGLVDVEAEQIKSSASAAESAPIGINVERAIAKIAFFVDKDLDIIPEHITLSGINHDELKGFWRVDVQNMKVYPIRKKAKASNGYQEVAATKQVNRYAEDPNFDTQEQEDFFLLPDGGADPIYDTEISSNAQTVYLGNPLVVANENLETTGYIDPKNQPANYAYLEYVAENTIADGAGYNTGTTTNILLMLKLDYVFQQEGNNIYYSNYYTYKGNVYPPDWMEDWLNEKTPPAYDGITSTALDEASFTRKADMIETFCNNKTPGEIEGLRYYADGTNYYRLPIRHFNDTQSPDANSYGRYGVVRNNTYVITLEEVTSLGRPTIPGPATITKSAPHSIDEEKGLRVNTRIHTGFN